MPDLTSYLLAAVPAAVAAALMFVAMGGRRRPASDLWLKIGTLAAVGGGAVVGYCVMSLRPAWPPANGLDRLLVVVLPAAWLLEMLVGFATLPRRAVWPLRFAWACAAGRVVLHNSIYLRGGPDGWTVFEAAGIFVLGAAVLLIVWLPSARLAARPGGGTVPLAVAMSIAATGLVVMLGGYIKGGAASLPLAAAIVGAVAAASASASFLTNKAIVTQTSTALALSSLFGLLYVGMFFGRLTPVDAAILLLSPLLGWLTERPALRMRRPWLVGPVRLILTAAALAFVVVPAKAEFDRKAEGLLGSADRGTRIAELQTDDVTTRPPPATSSELRAPSSALRASSFHFISHPPSDYPRGLTPQRLRAGRFTTPPVR